MERHRYYYIQVFTVNSLYTDIFEHKMQTFLININEQMNSTLKNIKLIF